MYIGLPLQVNKKRLSFILFLQEKMECSHILALSEQQHHRGHLFLSGVGMLNQSPILQSLEIKAVLTLLDGWAYAHFKVEPRIQHLQFSHKWIKLEDETSSSLTDAIGPAIDFIKGQLAKHNVLVHCQAGVSRSASIVIAYLMHEKGMSYEQAKALVKKNRKCIQPNQGFEKELLTLSQKLQQGKKDIFNKQP